METSLSLVPPRLSLELQKPFGNFWKRIKILTAVGLLGYTLSSCSLPTTNLPSDCTQIDPSEVVTKADQEYVANNAHDNTLKHTFYVIALTLNGATVSINHFELGTEFVLPPLMSIGKAFTCHYLDSTTRLENQLQP